MSGWAYIRNNTFFGKWMGLKVGFYGIRNKCQHCCGSMQMGATYQAQQCCVRLHGYLLYDSHSSASTIHPIFQNLVSFISETGYSLYKGLFSRLIEYRKAKVRHGVTFQYVSRRPRAISDKLCKHSCNEFAPVRLPQIFIRRFLL